MKTKHNQRQRRRPVSEQVPAVTRPRTAVVVDDHAGLRNAIAEQLEHHGWEVRAFASVEEALPDVRARLPDVVLTDLNVGVLSGAALARELRIDPATAGLTIVAMSGTTEPTPRMLALFDEYLPKPVDLWQLDERLRSAVARREKERRSARS